MPRDEPRGRADRAEAADEWSERTPIARASSPASVGPTNKTLSISPRRRTTRRSATSTFDAAARGVRRADARARRGRRRPDPDRDDLRHAEREGRDRGDSRDVDAGTLPILISVTITDRSGRTLSGQTIEAFWASVEHAEPLSSASTARSARARCGRSSTTSRASRRPTSPATRTRACRTRSAATTSTPEHDEPLLARVRRDGLVNVVGGCCGTTPEHIRAIAEAVAGVAPRPVPRARRARPRFSGLEPFAIGPDTNFLMIGERTNVTGSRALRQPDRGGRLRTAPSRSRSTRCAAAPTSSTSTWTRACSTREQAMTTFLNLIATEPEIARHPDHGRQLEVERDRGRPQVRAGQGRSSTRSA